jgi:DNA-binding NtrC family response regulator
MRMFMEHTWPGNIRELEHVVERAIILSRGEAESLHFEIDTVPVMKEQFSISDWPTLEALEARYIKAAIRKCGGKLSGPNSASELLGIHYTTLHAKMKKSVPLLETGRTPQKEDNA